MNKEKHSHKFHLLLHSADLIQEQLRLELLPLNLTPHQARVIKALNAIGPVSQINLAREFGITAASMSTMTTRLIRLGFINTEKDPNNAKRNLLSLTDDGIGLIDGITQAWNRIDIYMEKVLGINNVNVLADITLSLRDSLGGRMPSSNHKEL